MPNIETVRALINAFNVHNYFSNTVKTNFKLQSEGKKNYIVVSFDKSMDTYQCRRYLDSIKRKIIREFYGIEESNDAEILDTAKLIFDVNSFPFDINDRDWSWDKQHGFKFVTPVDKGVIFNLKSHLASSLKKDVLEGMPTCSIFTNAFDKKKYLWCGEFDNEELSQQFKSKFLSRMRERYKNVPKSPLKVEGNDVYIKDVFDDARFIDSVTRYKAWLTGMDLGVGNDVDHSVKSFKNMIIRSTYSVTKVMVDGFILAPPLNGRVVSILTPITQNGKGIKLLTKEEVRAINRAFNHAVLDDISGRTQAKLSVNGSSGIYGIDFSNPYISHCVITKIIKNSVINKDHELAIDPELCFRALSRSPSTELSDMKWESPTRSQGGVKDSPRQGSEREKETEPFRGVLGEEIGQASTSSQQTDMPSSSYTYIDKRDESMPEDSYFLPSTLTSFPRVITPPVHYTISTKPILLTTKNDQKSSSLEFSARSPCLKDVNILGMKSEEHDKSEQGACSQVGVRALEGDQADDESMLIKIQGQQVSYRPSLTPFPTAWDNSTFLNLEVSNEESEKQQVTDKSDRKSSNECFKAKPQKNESSKKHGGGVQKMKKWLSSTFSKQYDVNLKRHDEGRGTTRSTPETSVTKKLSVSRLFSSLSDIVRAENNSPSKETSPVSSLDGDPGPSQGTISGKGEVLPVEYRSDNSSSKTAVDRDSGFCSTGSPAAQHKGSVSSELKHLQQVKNISEALRK
ncbi:hypothetical protein HUB92_05255 [Wolbachia endosymbiont of Wiebesia pumilae]|jgi:hypothetical protein|uniref:hypothetical protein n=1 Tax=Wolbachia endosymbiont of Wiebesia pumilae TaxID=2742717 RepID=UPI001AEAFC94|nr:hypothetical protein [Wolbachia endosymbiont of Wiebesia pumilae]QTP62240.1 hypothetical protein HUB92_05255 [Wolbachia endosymbiont of Wiebesia pumilae]